ncbi:ankyrin repeat domain-containing protein 40-like [Coccinella septempunctata]|uniref:ankyrin repeat domain-containing protein 40-like n=1 Tax=Coccinella septempunctata TaxID=41139 RepID=UPI001D08DE26|nr:ankyrin repeat domain-containing protein 40-like [Coccinella septempunctata]
MEALEEKLREAACLGDLETVEKLTKQDININSKQKANGWTALHWACKKGHEDITKLLLSRGADPTIVNNKNETPADICSSPSVFNSFMDGISLANNRLYEFKLRTNILKNSNQTDPTLSRIKHSNITYMPSTMLPSIVPDEDIVLKIRISGSNDPDFIEVELPKWKLTYKNLLKLCCEELQCSEDQVERIRKLPNTRLRTDNDIGRLVNFQEIEIVMKGPPGSDKPTNCYQSISTCKDQTILY